jgi:alpha-mannosidase
MKFGLECQNPPVTGLVRGGPRSPLPPSRYALIAIDPPGILLWALKPHDDGADQGIVARLWNQSDAPNRFALTVAAGPLTKARKLTHLETTLTNLSVEGGVLQDTLPAQGMQTYGFNARDETRSTGVSNGFTRLKVTPP